ncbi:AcrR family transcriptional regulator [Caulobacter ginsengisoli]|uniref:AcrR family transcriptional regulator n=1 Tax=Caulobacter ginsengisoli TaxID=400775 RepID=A0ABU0IS39_9CAUL|nr:TetR/AcrR family transcriptional regulator [Caulobacter ginsengisoli]MDQ0464235.1 AcrR family transcriptional regulator [Caulobacter ginsengisoli]
MSTEFASVLPEPAQTDGRRRRADVNRQRIVDAMMALVREGETWPSAEAVASRAGVGLRTVFRLFSDMDGLYREMHAVMIERLTPIFHEPLGEGDWRFRLGALIGRRARLFEEMLPIKSAADAHRYQSPYLQVEHAQLVTVLRQILVFVVPETVRADTMLVDALDLALSFESWRRLRYDQNLDPAGAEAVMRRLADALVAGY